MGDSCKAGGEGDQCQGHRGDISGKTDQDVDLRANDLIADVVRFVRLWGGISPFLRIPVCLSVSPGWESGCWGVSLPGTHARFLNWLANHCRFHTTIYA